MNEWLMQHYGGVWYGGHHDYHGIPDDARSFLVFTTVRNPYDRAVSGFFGRTWDDRPRDAELRVAVPPPTAEDIDSRIERGRDDVVPYREFIEGAGVSLLLHFERLPECLLELPFVDPATIASFPHVLERGIRPPGISATSSMIATRHTSGTRIGRLLCRRLRAIQLRACRRTGGGEVATGPSCPVTLL